MPEKVLHANPIPEDVIINTLQGEMEFTCCGLRQKATGEDVTRVKCSRCQYSFVFILMPVRLSPDVFTTGTLVTLKEPVKTVLGCKELDLPAGQYKVYEDFHGVLGTLDEETLVCVESIGVERKMRTLVAPVPTDLLELVEVSDDRDSDSGSGGDAEIDSGDVSVRTSGGLSDRAAGRVGDVEGGDRSPGVGSERQGEVRSEGGSSGSGSGADA